MTGIEELSEAFRHRFGSEPALFRAPGRVNLIGEHTDYNDGFVMPAAIEFEARAAAAPRSDTLVRLHSLNNGQSAEFDLATPAPQAPPRLVRLCLRRRGDADGGRPSDRRRRHRPRILGADRLGPVFLGGHGGGDRPRPPDAGGLDIDPVDAGDNLPEGRERVCRHALRHHGPVHLVQRRRRPRADDRLPRRSTRGPCRSIRRVRIVVANSMVHHAHAGGEYNRRRVSCEEGVGRWRRRCPARLTALRDVSFNALEAHRDLLSDETFRRCRHVVTENARVVARGGRARSTAISSISGVLMDLSHASMRDDLRDQLQRDRPAGRDRAQAARRLSGRA